MITGIITLLMELAIPLINLFIKNAEKNKQLKEQMFRMAENHSKSVLKNVQIRKELEDLRGEIKKKMESKNVNLS